MFELWSNKDLNLIETFYSLEDALDNIKNYIRLYGVYSYEVDNLLLLGPGVIMHDFTGLYVE